MSRGRNSARRRLGNISSLGVAAALVTLVAACGGGPSSSQGDSGKGPIKIGVLASLSGARPLIGKVEQVAAQDAAEDINKAGGVNGRKIEILVQDDAFTTNAALTGAKRLIQDGVVAITGMASSNFQAAVQPVAARNKVVVMGSVGTGTTLTTDQPFGFRTSANNDLIGEQLDKMMAGYGVKRVAIVHDTSDYGQTLADAVAKHLEGTSVALATNQTFSPGATDLTPQILAVRKSNADAIVPLPVSGADLALVIKTMGNAGINIPIYGHNGLFDPDALKLASGFYSAAPRVCGVTAFDPDKPANKKLYSRIKGQINADPGNENAYQTYDAVQILAQALKKTDGEGGLALAHAIEGISHYSGGHNSGNAYYSFSPTKHTGPTGDFMARQCWENGKFVPANS